MWAMYNLDQNHNIMYSSQANTTAISLKKIPIKWMFIVHVYLPVIEFCLKFMLTPYVSSDIELTEYLAVVNLFQLCKE